MNKTQQLNKIYDSINGRYYNNSLGVFLIVSTIVFILFLLEIIKFAKKIYTHNIPHQQNKYLVSKILSKQQKIMPNLQSQANVVQHKENINNKMKKDISIYEMKNVQKTSQSIPNAREQTVQQLGKSIHGIKPPYNQPLRQERFIKFLHRSIQVIRTKLPLIAIALVNVSLLASFQYLLVTICIGIILFVIIQILKHSENQNIAWILDIIAHGIVIGWFVNSITIGMPI